MIYIYIYIIEIIQNLQICYLQFHAINDDSQAILKLSHNSHLLTDNITKTYKQSDNVYNSINLVVRHIAKRLEIADRVECMARKSAYITIKDHKENFNINPKCCLINPTQESC